MASSRSRGPVPLSDLLNDLFTAKGLGRLIQAGELESAWSAAVGEPGARHTQVGAFRRGVLNITVAHPTLLEELSSFQKPALLAALRRTLPDASILDLRFQIGSIDPKPADEPKAGPGDSKPNPSAKPAAGRGKRRPGTLGNTAPEID